jgi:hypothetical protein
MIKCFYITAQNYEADYVIGGSGPSASVWYVPGTYREDAGFTPYG